MPCLDGVTVARHLCSGEPAVPVVLMSACPPRRWQQAIAQSPPGAPVLTSPNDRVWFHGCLDMLRAAGAAIPQAFYRRGSIFSTSREEGREAASISLNALVTNITRALAYFTDDADQEPGETEPTEA